jgi:hypothetical protein
LRQAHDTLGPADGSVEDAHRPFCPTAPGMVKFFLLDDVMPISIKRPDKDSRLSQSVEVAGLRPAPPPHSRASYTALQTGFGVLGAWA